MSVLIDRAQAERLRSSHRIVPIAREILADRETPVTAFEKLAGEGPAFLLESVERAERWGRYSFVGLDPFAVITARDGVAKGEGEVSLSGSGPLQALRDLVEGFTVPDIEGLPPFYAGAVGFLGYDVVREIESLPDNTTHDVDVPDMLVMCPRSLVVFDHLRQRMILVSSIVGDGDSYDEAQIRIDHLVELLGAAVAYEPAEPPQAASTEVSSNFTRADFEAAVRTAKDHIMAGDAFQVVLSQRFSIPLECPPFDVYRMLRIVNPSPYMFYIRHPEVTLIGSSPEPLVKVDGRRVLQRPIAGTRPRGMDEAADGQAEDQLRADEKEKAEHVMLVDLARNDLGRVCEYGTISVDELMTVERYSHVMHLVSQVSGTLRPQMTALDALIASFPAGTVTGAPKIRAMEIIDGLEPTRRGPYAGVVGYFDFSGNLDTCIALRTGYVADGVLHVQAGAGIVADSDPAAEWQESLNKAQAVLTAARMAEGS